MPASCCRGTKTPRLTGQRATESPSDATLDYFDLMKWIGGGGGTRPPPSLDSSGSVLLGVEEEEGGQKGAGGPPPLEGQTEN